MTDLLLFSIAWAENNSSLNQNAPLKGTEFNKAASDLRNPNLPFAARGNWEGSQYFGKIASKSELHSKNEPILCIFEWKGIVLILVLKHS